MRTSPELLWHLPALLSVSEVKLYSDIISTFVVEPALLSQANAQSMEEQNHHLQQQLDQYCAREQYNDKALNIPEPLKMALQSISANMKHLANYYQHCENYCLSYDCAALQILRNLDALAKASHSVDDYTHHTAQITQCYEFFARQSEAQLHYGKAVTDSGKTVLYSNHHIDEEWIVTENYTVAADRFVLSSHGILNVTGHLLFQKIPEERHVVSSTGKILKQEGLNDSNHQEVSYVELHGSVTCHHLEGHVVLGDLKGITLLAQSFEWNGDTMEIAPSEEATEAELNTLLQRAE